MKPAPTTRRRDDGSGNGELCGESRVAREGQRAPAAVRACPRAVVAEPDARHTPVLTEAVGELLAPGVGQIVVDATVGLAGHAMMFTEWIGSAGTLIGLDVDAANLAVAERRLAGAPCKVLLVRRNFAELDEVLASAGLGGADVVFADLGVSSTQLDDPERGMSFQHDGPLDMRMDDRLTTTAADLVNALRENELADLIYINGQERFSRRIAKRICWARRDKRITTTGELVRVVCNALDVDPTSRRSKIHPATRVFQALRIEVNRELDCLGTLLAKAPELLNPNGRIGVISFHSLEDGMVKRDFRARKSEGLYEIVTKRPVVADASERSANRRSRSAKLRVARRTERAVAK